MKCSLVSPPCLGAMTHLADCQCMWHLGLWLAFAHYQIALYILLSVEILRRGGSLVGVTAMS